MFSNIPFFNKLGRTIFSAIFIFLLYPGCASSTKTKGVYIKQVIHSIDGDTVVPRSANKIYINSFAMAESVTDGY